MKVLETRDVLDKLGIGRSTLYEWRRRGIFPEPRQLGPQKVGWLEDDVDEWLESRPFAQVKVEGDGAGE